ncbi:nucleotidyltransferase domain-containing protein [Pyrobaculum sp.]|uniref:nucleotidyltransferase domain-containing protein n=1 Tax=Pyrobaculum sp. TaxID=2004705 RepID=UPI003D11695B
MEKRVVDAIQRFVEELRREGIEVVAVYLFGSWARGDWLVDSDVDLVIVSPHFRGVPWLKRLEMLARIEARLDLPLSLDVLPYTPEELEKAKSAVLRDASRYWRRVV